MTTSTDAAKTPIQSAPAYEGHPQLPVNLVLEGGAMRCQFTAGVLDFFMEKGLVVQEVIGVSAGALSGMNYVAGIPDRTCFMNLKYCHDDRFLSIKSFLQTGNVCGREFVFDTLAHELEPFDMSWFNDSPMKLTAVSSDLDTGEADYHRFTDLDAEIPYLISTSSLPLLSEIVEVDGKHLLDGGTVDSIPIDYSFATGAEKHIVVLTRDEPYRKSATKTPHLFQARYVRYPKFVAKALDRHLRYNEVHRRCNALHDEGKIFLLQPAKPVTLKKIGAGEEELLDLYAQGYQVAMENWDDLKAYLGI